MAEIQAATLLFIYAETALHPGTGSSLSLVDMPVQRERTTQYPTIQSSSVKGVLRSRSEKGATADLLYGSQNQSQEYAGAISFSDAKILLFPVRSMAGVFTWITCPAVLARLKRDLNLTGQTVKWDLEFSFPPNQTTAYVVQNSDVVTQSGSQSVVALEEFLFSPQSDEKVEKITNWLADHAFPTEFEWWRAKVRQSLVILKDDDFRDFVTTATEVVARTRLEAATKTVAEGALWYQEFLPSETLFYSVVLAQPARNGQGQTPTQILDLFRNFKIDRIQIGGDETIGKGFCKLHYLNPKAGD
jgi:CRISPR-associated protein Cmr4